VKLAEHEGSGSNVGGTLGLDTGGLETLGLETLGLETLGLDTVGLRRVAPAGRRDDARTPTD
jgi:hypothetical protein